MCVCVRGGGVVDEGERDNCTVCTIVFGMGIDSSIGDHHLMWSHIFRSVEEPDVTATS